MSDYTGDGVDPQGFLGSLLGKVAGRLIGGAVGGSTGASIGSIAGGIGGGFLPFSAGGPQQAAGQEQLSQVELQGFLDVLRKIGRGVGTGVDIGRQLGLFAAGGPQQTADQEIAGLLRQAMPALQALAQSGQATVH